MHDTDQPADLRMNAARLAAPFVHPKSQPEPRLIAFELPVTIDGSSGLLATHEALLRATADGTIALEDAKDISEMLETHRRLVDTVDLESRVSRLEQRKPS